MKIRCGPAAVIGYESREATVVIDGKGGRRTTREPEDLLALRKESRSSWIGSLAKGMKNGIPG